jgi:hypothetical protein
MKVIITSRQVNVFSDNNNDLERPTATCKYLINIESFKVNFSPTL